MTIRNVVFDVGGVLLELRYEPFIRHLAEAGIDMRDLPAWLTRVDIAGHERGEFTGDTLLERIAAMASPALDAADLRVRWLDMFVSDYIQSGAYEANYKKWWGESANPPTLNPIW